MRKFLFLTFSVWAIAFSAFAQIKVKGQIVDADNKEPLIGATVIEDGTSNGVISDIDGNFTLEVKSNATLKLSYVGYKEKTFKLKGQQHDLGVIEMQIDATGLDEVVVMASVVTDRLTPISVSTVSTEMIDSKLGTQEFPEILKMTPSIYASKEGGGFGEASVYVRGFDSNNVGVLINGIPVNDMENGKVYWSNWAGLSDVTRMMQVQRGLGASKLGLSSVGGTINILTKGSDAKKGGSIKLGVGPDGYQKELFNVSTGLMENGWTVTLLASHTFGNGYINGSDFDAWSYFADISKKINEQHTLAFMITGAPQWHNKRGNAHTIAQYQEQKDELKYNSDYGVREGEIYGGAYGYNYYHKPQAQLNHYWNIDDKTMLSTSLYGSIGEGGGRVVDGNKKSWLTVDYKTGEDDPEIMRTSDGLLDFESVSAANATYVKEGSQAIIGNSVNRHVWAGLLSTLTKSKDDFKYTAGLDARYYNGAHYKEVNDLLGGKFFLDAKNKNRPADTWLKKGDKYSYYNDMKVLYTGVFGQAEYAKDNLSVFLSGAIARKSYQRIEHFVYDTGVETSEWQNFLPWNVKAGASFKLTNNHVLFANAGYVQRTPYTSNVFLNYTNQINEDVKYEKIITSELGYKYESSTLNGKVTLYRTNWRDRGLVKSYGQQIANISGLNQLHQGVEVELQYKPSRKLKFEGMFSWGDWIYQDDVNAVVYDDNKVKINEFNAYLKDVHVGNSAQVTASLSCSYEIFPKLRLNADYTYYAKNYANFDATKRNDADFVGDSWKMPNVGLVDLGLNYGFKIGNLNSSFYFNMNNLLDTEYISKATDGNTHSANDALVYYGFGRTWAAGFKVKF